MGFFDALFGRGNRSQGRSASVAKQRLVEVLVHDHVQLSPEQIDAIRADIAVILARHIDVDAQGLEIDIRHNEAGDRLVADIPMKKARRRRRK